MHPIPILLYHRFDDDSGPNTTAPAVFAAHLEALAGEGWRPLTLAEFAGAVADGADVGPRRFLMTFDDGLKEIVRAAEPLSRHAISALNFLITDEVGAGGRCIGWEDARRLAADAGFVFASHSASHARWAMDAAGAAQLREDLLRSRARLSAELPAESLALDHLAWPWGRCSAEFEEVGQECGFGWQYLVQKAAVTRPEQTLRLPRLCFDGASAKAVIDALSPLAHPVSAWAMGAATSAVRSLRHGMAY